MSKYEPRIGDIIDHPSLGYEDPLRFKDLIKTNPFEATQMGYEDPLGVKQAPEYWGLLNIVDDVLIFAPCVVLTSALPEEQASEMIDLLLLRVLKLGHHETKTEGGRSIAIMGNNCILRTKADLGSRGAFDRISIEDAKIARPKIKDTGH